ncbi:MAG: Streptogramin A acetyltransferase [Syntrophus sp. SKADARSKE-3]|nr:Streptogramin A acetyltransferase [Syntrophus sp. SKADARSKE-3]
MNGPDPTDKHPMAGYPQICFIKNTISNPQIVIGDYTYYDDPENSEDFERNVMYLFPFIGDKLIIGKFCAIGRGVKFIMNGANHQLSSFSTYPFFIFRNGWERTAPNLEDLPYKGDTAIGNDVWVGYDSLIMPGVKIGDGAIIASRSVVVTDVAPYTIAGGNPANPIKQRFATETISALLEIKWWDWDAQKITRNLESIGSANLEVLRNAT